jgi:hypothetical protein
LSEDHDIELGRSVVADGGIQLLREELGLNRSSMAELLRTSVVTYTSWEARPEIRLWPSTAARIGRFYRLACDHLNRLWDSGIDPKNLVPFHHATTLLGVPQELLLSRYRDGAFQAEDLGILGLWVHREDLEKIKEVI